MNCIIKKFAVCEADTVAIDLDARRSEIEKRIGKERSEATFKVIAALRKFGDNQSLGREIYHFSYFKAARNARRFGNALEAKGYKLLDIAKASKTEVRVKFSHTGQTTVDSIVEYEASLPIMAKRHGGYYDGWETSVESGNPLNFDCVT